MIDVHERAYRPDDASAVAKLINTIFTTGGWQGGHTAAEIAELVTNEVVDAEADTLVISDADHRLVAVALVPTPPVGGDRVELIGGVHPDRRGEGIGRRLLAWQIERAAVRRAEVAPEAQWWAQVAAGVSDTSAIQLYRRLGFSLRRYFLEMTAPTALSPDPAPVEGVRIAPYSHQHERELYAVHMAAFRDAWGHQDRDVESWAALTVRSADFRPELARVALAGDAIVAFVLPYHRSDGRLYIGHVGTVMAWRRRGVAGSLLADVLGAAGRAGYTLAALDTDGDNPTGAVTVYAKVGFVTGQRVAVYDKPV